MKTTIKVRNQNDDGPHEIKAQGAAEAYAGPNEYALIPEHVGPGEHDENAKWEQRKHDRPRMFKRMMGNHTQNDMADQSEDQTNFLGYCNDN